MKPFLILISLQFQLATSLERKYHAEMQFCNMISIVVKKWDLTLNSDSTYFYKIDTYNSLTGTLKSEISSGKWKLLKDEILLSAYIPRFCYDTMKYRIENNRLLSVHSCSDYFAEAGVYFDYLK